jgi:hypothetical protein
MLRRIAVVSAFVLLPAGMVFGISGAASANPVLTGHVGCTGLSGGGTFHPKLTAAGSAGGVKFSATAKVYGCSGASITIGTTTYTVTGGVMKINDWYFNPHNSCAAFEGVLPVDVVGKIKMSVKWTLSPPLAVTPSHVLYSTGAYSAPVVGTTMALQLGFPVATPTAVTGSFAGSLIQDTLMNITVPTGGCPVGTNFTFPNGKIIF